MPCEGGKPNKTKTKANLKALSQQLYIRAKELRGRQKHGGRNKKKESKPKLKGKIQIFFYLFNFYSNLSFISNYTI